MKVVACFVLLLFSSARAMYLSDLEIKASENLSNLLADLDTCLDRHVRVFIDKTSEFIRFFYPPKSRLLSQHLSLYARNLTMVQVLLTGLRVRVERSVETDRLFALLEFILRQWLFARPLIWRDPDSGLSLLSVIDCEHLRRKSITMWLQMMAGHLIRFQRHFDNRLHAHRQAKQQAILCGKLVHIMLAVDKLYGHEPFDVKEVFERESLLSSMASGAMILLRRSPKFESAPESVVYEMSLAVEQIAIFLYNTQMPKSDLAIEVIVLNAPKIMMHADLLKQIVEYRRLKVKTRNDLEMERMSQMEKSLLALEKEHTPIMKQKTVLYESFCISESESEEEDQQQEEQEKELPNVNHLSEVPLLYRSFALVQWAQECRKRFLIPLRRKIYPHGKPATWSWEQGVENDHECQVCLQVVKKRDDLVHGTEILKLISNTKDAKEFLAEKGTLIEMHPSPNEKDDSLRPFEIEGLPPLAQIRKQMIWVALGTLCEMLPKMAICQDIVTKRNEAAHPKLMQDKAVLKQLWTLI